jgi:hypothetical protein
MYSFIATDVNPRAEVILTDCSIALLLFRPLLFIDQLARESNKSFGKLGRE